MFGPKSVGESAHGRSAYGVTSPVLAIGRMGAFSALVEGGYNHVVKNIVYFAAGEETTWQLFQPPLYDEHEIEMPNDIFFEVTGILQFPLAVVAGLATIAMIRTLRRANRATP